MNRKDFDVSGQKANKFFVGQRVKYTGSFSKELIGEIGTVRSFLYGGDIVNVSWDSGKNYGVYADNIIQIEIDTGDLEDDL